MTISTEDLLNSIMESFDRIDYIKTADIPNIDLYMDQVTTFMDHRLKSTTRQETDKILTKTMINNYAKNDLLPPPVKKKYSKDHLLVLIFIYYFKGFLSISDIQELLQPITDRFFRKEDGLTLSDIYEEVFQMEGKEIQTLKKDVARNFEQAQKSFADADEESRDFLQQFYFICMLSFDVYVKKLLIEKLIDEMRSSRQSTEESDKEEKKNWTASYTTFSKKKLQILNIISNKNDNSQL